MPFFHFAKVEKPLKRPGVKSALVVLAEIRRMGQSKIIDDWRLKARLLINEIDALYLCSKHPRVPWYAKGFAFLILGYALSPIDLIPDFIPVIGYLDDLILVPIGIALLIRMIPRDVSDECREKAKSHKISKGSHWLAASIIILIWLLAIYFTVKLLWNYFQF